MILCPSHLTHKWVRELEETIPGARGRILHSISDAEAAFKEFHSGNYTIYAIVSKERARDGYSKKPAVYYSQYKKGFICPSCLKKIMMELSEDSTKYLVDADQFYFRKETSQNHKCPECGELLWTSVNPNDKRIASNQWVKIGEYGYVYRSRIDEYVQATGDEDLVKSLLEIRDNPDVFFPVAGAYRTQSNSPMEFIVTAGKLALKAEAELGKVHETIVVETKEVAETSFWYNPRYLLDAARAVRGEAVVYISAKGMLLVTAENFNFITAPIIKPNAATLTKTGFPIILFNHT